MRSLVLRALLPVLDGLSECACVDCLDVREDLMYVVQSRLLNREPVIDRLYGFDRHTAYKHLPKLRRLPVWKRRQAYTKESVIA